MGSKPRFLRQLRQDQVNGAIHLRLARIDGGQLAPSIPIIPRLRPLQQEAKLLMRLSQGNMDGQMRLCLLVDYVEMDTQQLPTQAIERLRVRFQNIPDGMERPREIRAANDFHWRHAVFPVARAEG